MLKKLKQKMMVAGAASFAGLVSGVESASANDFNAITDNIVTSISDIPGMLTGISYMMGILLGVLGVLKIKDHVENPGNTPLQQGAVRLAAGGALFALPIVYEAMLNTIGADQTGVEVPTVNAIDFDVN